MIRGNKSLQIDSVVVIWLGACKKDMIYPNYGVRI